MYGTSNSFIDPNYYNGRFAERKELEQDYKWVDLNDPYGETKAAGTCISVEYDKHGKVCKILVDDSESNTLIVSNTGSGKTRRVLSPYILSCIKALESFVCHDPKGELYMFFVELLKKYGYDVFIINLREPLKGHRFNILQKAAQLYREGNEDRALEIVSNIAESIFSVIADKEDLFWTEVAKSLFICYFIMAVDLYPPEEVSLKTIYRIHIEGMVKMGASTALAVYLDAHKESKAYEHGIYTVTAPNDTRNSIFAVFSGGISRLIINDAISDTLSDSSDGIENISNEKKPTAVFIITRDEAPGTYSTVVASTIDLIYTSLIDQAQSREGLILPRRVHFILEEFGNIAALNNINNMLTASRSRGIRIVAVVQSLSQLDLIYNEKLSRNLIGNFHNLIYMNSTDMELVEIISKRCGTYINPYTNSSEPLLSPNLLTHLDKKRGETLMLLDRHYPYIAYLPDMTCYKDIAPIPRFEVKERKVQEKQYGKLTQYAKDVLSRRSEGQRSTDAFGREVAKPLKDRNLKIMDMIIERDKE